MATTHRTRGTPPMSVSNGDSASGAYMQPLQQLQNHRTALILGGWSPGPFFYLESFLRDNHGFSILQPAIEMPPVTVGWCCQWQTTLLLLVYAAFLWFMRQWCRHIRRQNDTAAAIAGVWLLILLATCVWFRVLVAYAVHSSIQSNVKICQKLIADHNVSLVLGFSFGGVVAAELLAQQQSNNEQQHRATTPIRDDSHVSSEQEEEVSFLLMAPTTALVAKLDLFQPCDAALRVNVSSSCRRRVVVVHATNDAVFCPHAYRWRAATSNNHVDLTFLRDNHVFLRSASERALKEIVSRLIQTTTTTT